MAQSKSSLPLLRSLPEGPRGIKIDKAEKIAEDFIKKKTGMPAHTSASEKEFKEWLIYLKNNADDKFKVRLDIEGEIVDWETLNELPSFFTGPM